MKKLLVMVPSRGRPKRLDEFIKSLYDTKSISTDVLFYLNEDDPKLLEYTPSDYRVIVGKRLYLAEAYNYIFQKYPDYEYYSLLNDDHYFLTPGWDKKLIEMIEEKGGWGLSCCEDHLTDWNKFQHPSGMVISGNIPRTLGYMIWPKIQHIGIDCFFKELLTPLNLMYHTMDVVIEHRHWINGKALLDENYKWVYHKDQFQYGMGMVEEYKKTKLNDDIEKLKQAMKGEKL
jgi:hypothetical protein